jgi:hypothetical protein
MKNFKQIAFGLLVGALAIGFSAFTNASKSVKASKFTTYYYTNDGSNYQIGGTTAPDPDNCSVSGSKACVVSSTTDLDADAPFANTNPNHYPITQVGTKDGVWSN